MEKVFVSAQVSLFTNNSDITPESGNLVKFIAAFSSFKLIPTFGNEINPLNGEKQTFLRFTNESESLLVNFFPQCINIVANVLPSQSKTPETRMQGSISDILKKIRPIVPQKKFNRVAAIKNIVYRSDHESGSVIGNALLKDIDFKGNAPFEWDYRLAHRINAKSNGENLNIVSSVKNATIAVPNFNNGKPFTGIVIETDCNSIFENAEMRFNFASLEVFLAELLELSVEVSDSAVKKVEIE